MRDLPCMVHSNGLAKASLKSAAKRSILALRSWVEMKEFGAEDPKLGADPCRGWRTRV
jgi:hypothetical protein